jgi:hypothetical protein
MASVNDSILSTSFEFQLLADDANAIKNLTALATSRETAFVLAEEGTVRDVVGNRNAAQPPIRVASYTEDLTAPAFISATVNMNNLQIRVVFDETVNASSVIPQNVIIQSQQSAGSMVRLTGGSVTSSDSTIVVVTLSNTDANRIKAQRDLATNETNTYIKLLEEFVSDMNVNDFAPVPNASHIAALVVDNTDPILSSCAINMNNGSILLAFDETINTASIINGQVQLQSAMHAPPIYNLTGGNVSQHNSPLIIIELTDLDLNAVKVQTNLFVNQSTSFISVTTGAASDMTGNAVAASTIACDQFVADTTSPELISFSLDMNIGQITMTFSEAVKVSSFVPQAVSLAGAAERGSTNLTFTGGSTSMYDGTVVYLNISTSDLNEIKLREDLGTGTSTTYLFLSSDAIVDMNFNEVVQVTNEDAIQASRFIEDTRAADLTHFDLNLDNRVLVLTFSETVNATSIDVTQITVVGRDNNTLVTLTGANSTSVQDSTIMSIVLLKSDVEGLKLQEQLCTNASDCFLAITLD